MQCACNAVGDGREGKLKFVADNVIITYLQ
jgi:hypothetical protein